MEFVAMERKTDLIVIDPRLLPTSLEPERADSAIFAQLNCLPLLSDPERLLVGMLNPSDRVAREDLQMITGLTILPARLDVRGGYLPTWEQLEPTLQTRLWPRVSWKPPPSPQTRRHVQAIFDSQAAERELRNLAWLYQSRPLRLEAELKGPPGLQLLVVLLRAALEQRASELWVVPMEKWVVALGKVGGEWKELATPGKFNHEDFICSLKVLTGPAGLQVLDGERLLQCAVAVTDGLHGQEAVLRF